MADFERDNPTPRFLRQFYRHGPCREGSHQCSAVLDDWKIVGSRPYSRLTLVNNWVEDRSKYCRMNYKHDSTYRIDYQPFCSPTVDLMLRRKAKLNNEGGQLRHTLFGTDNCRNHGNSITWYDEQYNGRERGEEQQLPAERDWNISRNRWEPERTDYPIRGEPTNWGLLERLQKKWERQREEEGLDPRLPDYRTTYFRSYSHRYPPEAYALTRYATPLSQSLSNSVVDRINKDLPFKISNQPEMIGTLREGVTPGVCEPKHPPQMLYN